MTGPLRWSDDAAVNVVLAAPGYPEAPRRGLPIDGVKRAADVPGVRVFHAGTAILDGTLVTAGGRVLSMVGMGPDLGTARRRAYEAANAVVFPGKHFRLDIAMEEAST